MFRHHPKVSLPTQPVLEPVEGFFFKTVQQALHFGANRAVAINYRPSLSMKRRDNFAVVLPATSKQQANNPHFYAVTAEEVVWNYAETRSSFLYYQFESIPLTALERKLGMVSQNTRMQIAHWLQRMWG